MRGVSTAPNNYYVGGVSWSYTRFFSSEQAASGWVKIILDPLNTSCQLLVRATIFKNPSRVDGRLQHTQQRCLMHTWKQTIPKQNCIGPHKHGMPLG